jgi:CheY-like chemotaxis protein
LNREKNDSAFRILVVEDDELSREVVQMFLDGQYETDIAQNPDSALKLAKEKKYSIILMDINLGAAMTGIELAKIIRQLPGYKEITMIATTAFVMENNKEEFAAAGFSDYLAKPYSRRELLSLIARHIIG